MRQGLLGEGFLFCVVTDWVSEGSWIADSSCVRPQASGLMGIITSGGGTESGAFVFARLPMPSALGGAVPLILACHIGAILVQFWFVSVLVGRWRSRDEPVDDCNCVSAATSTLLCPGHLVLRQKAQLYKSSSFRAAPLPLSSFSVAPSRTRLGTSRSMILRPPSPVALVLLLLPLSNAFCEPRSAFIFLQAHMLIVIV